MISISRIYEQAQQQAQQVSPEENFPLVDRIFARAVERIPNPDVDEEAGIEDEVIQRIDQEKHAAKVAARVAEERNRDAELKQLKAAEAIHNKEAAEDTKALETGMVPEKVAKDKAEMEAERQVASGQVSESKMRDYI
jgi:membrane protein involved in colicin uptake